MSETITIKYDNDKKARLDHVITEYIDMDDYSREQIVKHIKNGKFYVNDIAITKPSFKITYGDMITGQLSKATIKIDLWQTAKNIIPSLNIFYEDEDIIIFDKPAGLVMHPSAGHDDNTIVHHLLAHTKGQLANFGANDLRPGIVHRLDKDTSGVMVAAKTQRAYFALTKIFANHDLTRIYDCLVWGNPQPIAGDINKPIGRSPHNRKKQAIVSASQGKNAITHYTAQAFFGGVCAHLRCQLETGRTHQIRVHLSHKGHGVIGDDTYGRGKAPMPNHQQSIAKHHDKPLTLLNQLPRMALHASVLEFAHPIYGDYLNFESPIAQDINFVFDGLYAMRNIHYHHDSDDNDINADNVIYTYE